jgi:class 3 adenylate cyclase
MTILDQDSVDLERENAELRRLLALRTAERDEALAQQTATAEVLQVINASPGDLAPVFDAILEKAMRLCEAAFGVYWGYDGEFFKVALARGVPAEFNEFLCGNAHSAPKGSDLARLTDGDAIVHRTEYDDTAIPATALARAFVELGQAKASLLVALRREEQLLGALTVYRQENRAFSEQQIGLLQNFASQAVIAIENARLLTETREALEQQTATAEVLQVINASPGDLAPVFDAMLEKALRLCDASFGQLVTSTDGEVFTIAAAQGPPPIVEFLRNRPPTRPGPGSSIERLVRGERSVHIHDAMAEEAYQRGDPTRRALVDLGGCRTLVSVGLRKDDTLLGMISVYRSEVKPFSTTEIALLENFAAQAVIAMENARLLTETREALEQQTATAEVLQVINSSPGDLTPVFDAMLEKATRVCQADFGVLLTLDGDDFRTAALHNVPPDYEEFMRRNPPQPGPKTGVGRILRGERVVCIEDITQEEAYREGDLRRRAIADLGGARSYVAVGLFQESKLLGTLAAYRKTIRPFTDRQIALLQSFAAQAVIAMENARLLGELRARTDEVAAWNRELEDRVAAQLGELERAGRLKRFLAPQLAELIVARGDENILETHRRDIVVVFCDLRGFTAFAETAEPEEVLDLLREYHGALGPVVAASEGTLDHFSGDGIMVFFNDPVPVPDASERAVRMAIAMRAAMALLQARWRRQGRAIGFGAGIARGYATLGQIGFAERVDYTAIGTVCNLAARLCAEAKDGQILISRRVAAAVEDAVRLEEIGDLALKGLMQAVAVFNIATE